MLLQFFPAAPTPSLQQDAVLSDHLPKIFLYRIPASITVGNCYSMFVLMYVRQLYAGFTGRQNGGACLFFCNEGDNAKIVLRAESKKELARV